jgi:hypothetical protein
MNDPDKNRAFIKWCRMNNFVSPQIGSSIESQIEGSHDEAINSFNDASRGQLKP